MRWVMWCKQVKREQALAAKSQALKEHAARKVAAKEALAAQILQDEERSRKVRRPLSTRRSMRAYDAPMQHASVRRMDAPCLCSGSLRVLSHPSNNAAL